MALVVRGISKRDALTVEQVILQKRKGEATKMRNAPIIVLMAVLLSTTTVAKCANRLIHITGDIVSVASEGLKVDVKVVPDPNWEPQFEIALQDGKFVGTVVFNATKAERNVRDDCSRAPKEIEIVLLNEGRELDRARLTISKDFVKNKVGDYELRSPVVLRSH
jgi:hypothetical protein